MIYHISICILALVLSLLAVPVVAEENAGTLTPDQAFDQLKSWDYGQPRKPLVALELAISRATGDPAEKRRVAVRLAAVLADPQATDAAKLFACQNLPLVASDPEVPVLAKLLDDPKNADMARRTLECIPGEASLAAIRAAVSRVKGDVLVGVINSLGARRDGASTATLTSLLAGPDSQAAAAAAWALGNIGTADAVAALAKVQADAKLLPVVRDALLRCAESLAAGGNAAAAEGVYRQVLSGNPPAPLRLAVLAGLVKVSKESALPPVLEALGGGDPQLQAGAVRLTRDLAGEKVTTALVQQLDKLAPQGQALVIEVLGDRADKSAAAAVAKRLDDKDDAVRAAAARAMARLGDAASVDRLATLAATDKGDVRQGARVSLVRLAGADVDKRMLAAAAEAKPEVRVELFLAMTARRTAGASPMLLKAAAGADESVRTAALEALAVLGQAADYPKLVELLVASKAASEAVEKAVLAVGGRMATLADRAGPVLAALKSAPADAKPALLRVVGSLGGAEALQAVRANVTSADAAVRDAAVRALANWADESAADDLLAIVKNSESGTHRVLALRGYLRLAAAAKEEATRLKMLAQVRPIATTTDSKKMLLAGLGDVPDPAALDMALALVGDKEVEAEASAAATRIARMLAKTNRAAVQAAADRLKDGPGAEQGRTLLAQALLTPDSPEVVAKALQYDKARSDALKKDLVKRAPTGYRLACYLDCGPDTEDGAAGGPTLRVVGAQVHLWPGAETAGPIRFGTIAFDGRQVLFEAKGLNPKRPYRVGFSWWDFDHDTRAESVWMADGKGGREVKVLDKTKLPSGQSGPAEERTLAVPADLYADGTLRVMFRNESSPNAVVSEIWLWEGEASPAGPSSSKPPAAEPAAGAAGDSRITASPAASAAGSKDAGSTAPGAKPLKKVVIVTGMEYPGHKWKETAPAMAAILRQDPRLEVRVVEDPNFLGSPELKTYDVIFLNYMNWEVPAPGAEARKNFQECVSAGAGLVLEHFACGAFQDWPEFRNLAGRSYDPKLRPHDPFGTFRVEIAKLDHPVTKGLKAFDTPDELYTCLAGDRPVEVLATARSKVDGKDYPMAFAFTYGKGRVFHCVLGHDVKALVNPPVAELYRRGTAWAAGLEPP
jgi:HEAT repeat protein/type 1 glutamine amidotransferase